MDKSNKVYIATSLDGYIADKDGGIEWLETFPEINTIDTGYESFTAKIDALLMGRNTFETVCGFDIEWPYKKKVFVLSNSLKQIDYKYEGKVELVHGDLKEVVKELNIKGYNHLYIDGGRTIQSFLQEDLIDEMIITTIPVLLGEGIPLFSPLDKKLKFECHESQVFLKKVVQNRYVRIR